jgi:hypothetical protein
MVGTAFNTVHANDFSYYEGVNELVQEEPVDALDAERAGQLAAIGIANGQPFAPEERMRGTLQQAARIGAGMARATDTQTRSLLQVPSTVHPALSSSTGSLHANDDGSYDLYFGPRRARRQRVQPDRDRSRQIVVPALPPVRTAATLVRSDLESQRVRAHRLTRRLRALS